jgi:glucokinase
MKKKPGPRVIAFDLGGTKLASAVVDSQGAILAQHREFVEFGKGVEGFKKFLLDRALDWKRQFPEVKALGIASCGPLDPSRGVLLQPTNFPKWGDITLLGPLTRKLKLPVAFQNDAAAAALAEGWVGGARTMRNWIVLTLGTGVGTGIVMDRKPFMGGSGFGPEAGHQIVTDKPYPCGCGNTGCAESVLSGTGLRNRIKELKLPIGGSPALVEAAK